MLTAFAALALPAAIGSAAAPGADATSPRFTRLAGAPLVELRAGSGVDRSVPVEAKATAAPRGSGANIVVTYNAAFNSNTAAKNAFQRAVNTVKAKINSPQTIRIQANWVALGPGVLGSAGSNGLWLYHPDHRSYATAVLERKLNQNLNGTQADINANFSSAFDNWYFGTGNSPVGTYDFTTVVLHEILHGLGFFGSMWVSGSNGMWGWSNGTQNYKMRYDQFQWTTGGSTGGLKIAQQVNFPNPSAALKTQLTDSGVFFGGPNVMAANGGNRVKLFAPNPWQGGSSNAHFNEATFAPGTLNALMTPYLDDGEQIRSLGAMSLAMLRDIGWTTN